MLDGIYGAQYENWYSDSDGGRNDIIEFQLVRFDENGKVVCRRVEGYEDRECYPRRSDSWDPETVTVEGSYTMEKEDIQMQLQAVGNHNHRVPRVDCKYWGQDTDESLFFNTGRYCGRQVSDQIVFVRLTSVSRDWLIQVISLGDRVTAEAGLWLWLNADCKGENVWDVNTVLHLKKGFPALVAAGLIEIEWRDPKKLAGHVLFSSCAIMIRDPNSDRCSDFRLCSISDAFAVLDNGLGDAHKSSTRQELYQPRIGHLCGITLNPLV